MVLLPSAAWNISTSMASSEMRAGSYWIVAAQPRRSVTSVTKRSMSTCCPTEAEEHASVVPREAAVLAGVAKGSASRPRVVMMGGGVG